VSSEQAQVYALSEASGPLRQGEVISDLAQSLLVLQTVGSDRPALVDEKHHLSIILSQDCDLEQDWRARQAGQGASRQELRAVLFAHAELAVTLRQIVNNARVWENARQNQNQRYEFLAAVPAEYDAIGEGLGEMGIDFKRYFTFPTDEVYKRLTLGARRRCRLCSPYLEHLSTRFCYYQLRVALPMDHHDIVGAAV